MRIWRFLTVGWLTGLTNGLLGVGGGTVLVPALVFWLRIPDREAHATALAVILPTAAVSAALYWRQGWIELPLAGGLAPWLIGGAVLGALALRRLSVVWVRRIFASTLILAGLRMIL